MSGGGFGSSDEEGVVEFRCLCEGCDEGGGEDDVCHMSGYSSFLLRMRCL